jgi:hypoxanthine phosphoribosyltransferase
VTERETAPKPKDEVLFTEEQIKTRVQELAVEIAKDYPQEKIILVGVLNGAFIFTSDLIREIARITPNVEVDFIKVTSYSSGKESSREPIIQMDVHTPLSGQNVILVEDIVDTGYSFQTLLAILQARSPKSLKTCAFLSKDGRREVDVPVDYLGFRIDDVWVEGFGLDSKGFGRGNPCIIKKN